MVAWRVNGLLEKSKSPSLTGLLILSDAPHRAAVRRPSRSSHGSNLGVGTRLPRAASPRASLGLLTLGCGAAPPRGLSKRWFESFAPKSPSAWARIASVRFYSRARHALGFLCLPKALTCALGTDFEIRDIKGHLQGISLAHPRKQNSSPSTLFPTTSSPSPCSPRTPW